MLFEWGFGAIERAFFVRHAAIVVRRATVVSQKIKMPPKTFG